MCCGYPWASVLRSTPNASFSTGRGEAIRPEISLIMILRMRFYASDVGLCRGYIW